jgi:hypothetical protein
MAYNPIMIFTLHIELYHLRYEIHHEWDDVSSIHKLLVNNDKL